MSLLRKIGSILNRHFFVALVFCGMIAGLSVLYLKNRDEVYWEYQTLLQQALESDRVSGRTPTQERIHALDRSINNCVAFRDQFHAAHAWWEYALEVGEYGYELEKETETDDVPQEPTVGRVDAFLAIFKEIQALGIPVVYLQAPGKCADSFEEMDTSSGLGDMHADQLLKELAAQQVWTLDLRRAATEGDGLFSLFYQTDNHWKGSTALWVLRSLQTVLGDKTPWDTSVWAEEAYTSKPLLPSRTCEPTDEKYPLPSDYALWVPKAETSLTGVLHQTPLFTKAGFEQAWAESFYGASEDGSEKDYLLRTKGQLFCVTNEHAPQGTRVFLLGDQTRFPLLHYLALGCQEVRTCDLRDEALVREALQTKPDWILVVAHPDTWE